MIDYTIKIYKLFLEALKKKYPDFYTFREYVLKLNTFSLVENKSFTIFRHDVDRIPENALKLAQIENSLGVRGTYYFRVVPESYNLEKMTKIEKLGHEIGYHYEDVDLVIKKYKRKINNHNDREHLIDLAYESFNKNLEMLRKYFDIKTICMHGSPRSKYDNKIIWEKYNYKDLGILGEPYLDINWSEWAYFTDTGRRWNSNKINIRDKVNSNYNFSYKSTYEVIKNIEKLPKRVMFTIHPERWSDNLFFWLRNLVEQNFKNIIKRFLSSNIF